MGCILLSFLVSIQLFFFVRKKNDSSVKSFAEDVKVLLGLPLFLILATCRNGSTLEFV